MGSSSKVCIFLQQQVLIVIVIICQIVFKMKDTVVNVIPGGIIKLISCSVGGFFDTGRVESLCSSN